VRAHGIPSLETKIARCFAFAGPYMKLDAHFASATSSTIACTGARFACRETGLRALVSLRVRPMVWLWTILFRTFWPRL